MNDSSFEYTTPPPKAPYQLGDIAVVRTFVPKGSQTKKSTIHIGKIGTVTGYKNVPGAYSKYKLQFEDGSEEAYMPTYLIGPLRNKDVAQKYIADPSSQIDPSDLKTKSGKILLDQWEINEKLETRLKEILTTTYYFKWLDNPVRTNYQEDLNSVVFCIAELEGFFPIGLYRKHNRSTKALKGNVWGCTSARGYILVLPDLNRLKPNLTSKQIWDADCSQQPIDYLIGKRPLHNSMSGIFSEKYNQLYRETFDSVVKIHELKKKLPELEGIF